MVKVPSPVGLPVIVDSSDTQQSGMRCPSPHVFVCIDQLLCRRSSTFTFDFLRTSALISACELYDEDEMVARIFTRIKREGFMRRSSEDLLYGEEVATLDDLVAQVEKVADAGGGKCAAVLSKNGTASVVAKKFSKWFFVSLNYQSEEKHFAPGSHIITFGRKDEVLAYLKKLSSFYKADIFEDEWHAVFYTLPVSAAS